MKDYEYKDESIIDIAYIDNIMPSTFVDLSTIASSLAYNITQSFCSSLVYDVQLYPPKHNKALYSAISHIENVDPDSIILGSSIAECIFYIFSIIAPERVLLVGPLFSEYARICRVLSIPYIVYPLEEEYGYALTDEDIQAIRSYHPTLTVFCTPNTITGSIFPIALALHAIASPWIIVDATLKEYMFGTNHYDDLHWNKLHAMAKQGTHLLTLHDCSPFFATNGASMAYIVLKKEQKTQFSIAFPKYSSIPLYTQKLYTACYSSIQQYRETIKHLEKGVHDLIAMLKQYTIFTAFYSTLSLGFVMCQLHQDISASLLYNFLRSHHILVYWCVESTGCKSTMFRIKYVPNTLEKLSAVLDAFIETL